MKKPRSLSTLLRLQLFSLRHLLFSRLLNNSPFFGQSFFGKLFLEKLFFSQIFRLQLFSGKLFFIQNFNSPSFL